MIDLHTHTLFSDGELLPSELVRRAEVKGYEAIAITDHADPSNIDFVLPRIVRVCKILNKRWKIRSMPGVEITHAPLEEIQNLVRCARRHGAKIVVVHGETVSEPVIKGTNRSAIDAGCDILAHPGLITEEDAMMAKKAGVCLEITTRKSHNSTNRYVFDMANRVGADLVLNTDSHSPNDLITNEEADNFLKNIGLSSKEIEKIYLVSKNIVKKVKF